jgi:hypothetical protein
VHEVEVPRRPLEALAGVLTAEQADGLRAVAARSAAALSGRPVWNVNSTATGGGVAEMRARSWATCTMPSSVRGSSATGTWRSTQISWSPCSDKRLLKARRLDAAGVLGSRRSPRPVGPAAPPWSDATAVTDQACDPLPCGLRSRSSFASWRRHQMRGASAGGWTCRCSCSLRKCQSRSFLVANRSSHSGQFTAVTTATSPCSGGSPTSMHHQGCLYAEAKVPRRVGLSSTGWASTGRCRSAPADGSRSSARGGGAGRRRARPRRLRRDGRWIAPGRDQPATDPA